MADDLRGRFRHSPYSVFFLDKLPVVDYVAFNNHFMYLQLKFLGVVMGKRLLRMVLLVALFSMPFYAQNPWNGKVVFQAYWWDYSNDNYPNGWYNYLTELAPRLKNIGIDAVWIPPVSKASGGTYDVGYGVYDHYDLGDKYQKTTLPTRLGTKDELLRMVSVMHANGIDVIFDLVLNHSNGAGTQDPSAPDNKWKNFRYASYSTPELTGVDNTTLQGRWPKNHHNFHPNTGHWSNSGNWAQEMFGPDACYYQNATGLSSNAVYNPGQSSNHMRNNARDWVIWLKKQTGFDGVRLDAVKHFPEWLAEDLLYNLQYSAGWASGGSEMFAVGEYVGSGSELDAWANAVQNRSGTFDFSLRQAIKNVVSSSGSYDLGTIPGSQQANRTRTVPFVNNHDTFRPILNSAGNYIGWDSGNELGGGHIDPFDGRLEMAYAIAMSVDGSPQVFFEDLFNVGNTSKRFTHLPTSAADLPVRDGVANLIWCHQKLDFKAGAYKVRHQSQDNLIIERSGKAIIGINDSWSNWQGNWIPTDFAPGTRLHDYSGANSSDIWVNGSGWVQIWTPPCNGSNLRRGYTVWGPAGVSGGFSPAERNTVQEWEMADDLGDSHPSSLQQGGALPNSSIAKRTAGYIFSAGSKAITVNVYPAVGTQNVTVGLYSGGSAVQTVSGSGNLTLNYTPGSTGWYGVAIHNSSAANNGQNAWVKVDYTAPQSVNTSSYPAPTGGISKIASGEEIQDSQVVPQGVQLYGNYPNPFNPTTQIRFSIDREMPVRLTVYNSLGQQVATLLDQAIIAGQHQAIFDGSDLNSGVYFLRLETPAQARVHKLMLVK